MRARGLDVWYDRTNLQAGHSLSSDIEAELRRRSAFVVIATPNSLASQWVRSEIAAFRSLAAKDSTRLFLPVRAAECEMPLLWADILWINAVSLGFDAAVDAMAVALGAPTTPAAAASQTSQTSEPVQVVTPTPQPVENKATPSAEKPQWLREAAAPAPTAEPVLAAASPTPQPVENVDYLLEEGSRLWKEKQLGEAIPGE